MDISVQERKRLADLVGCHEQYFYQCLTGRNAMNPKLAVRIEQLSAGKVMRWHLRPQDWHEYWPELIGRPGAPALAPVQTHSRLEAASAS